VAGAVLRADPTSSLEAELQQEQVEIESAPCRDLTDLARQLRERRQHADQLARRSGARVAALGTSPLPVHPQTTPHPRYQAMGEHFGLTTAEQLTCGCHVHVGIDSAAEGVAVLDRIRPWLPVLLAVSANSPFWQGVDSGYASFRSQAWSRFPSAGPTELFGSAEAYHRRVGTMIDSGALLDAKMVYFDARLSESFPTVELRVADVCLRLADTVVVAALARALVDTAARDWRAGTPPPEVPLALLRLLTWRAGRSGLGGELVDPRTLRPRPAADVLDTLLDHLGDALDATGDHSLVTAGIARMLGSGTGAAIQRAWYADRHELADVALRAADVTLGAGEGGAGEDGSGTTPGPL
jgi:carboxylate-amine ligase